MRLVEVFDIGIEVMPRKVRRLILVALLLFSGGAFVNWYVQEKAAGYEHLLNGLVDDVVQRLLPPSSDAAPSRRTSGGVSPVAVQGTSLASA